MISSAPAMSNSKFAGIKPQGIQALSHSPLVKSEDKFAKLLQAKGAEKQEDPELRKSFDTFVGETFYGQMLSSMKKMTGKTPYFDGGRAEEVFRGQLNQVLATEMTKASANSFTGPMYDLFVLNRK